MCQITPRRTSTNNNDYETHNWLVFFHLRKCFYLCLILEILKLFSVRQALQRRCSIMQFSLLPTNRNAMSPNTRIFKREAENATFTIGPPVHFGKHHTTKATTTEPSCKFHRFVALVHWKLIIFLKKDGGEHNRTKNKLIKFNFCFSFLFSFKINATKHTLHSHK